MPRAVVFHRFVVDVVAQPDGTIAPAQRAVWRREPARDEGELPEHVASLAEATDAQILASASRFGPLRLRAGELVGRDAFVREAVARDALELLTGVDAAREWYATGMHSPPPTHARAYVAGGAALASLPGPTQYAIEQLLSGQPWSPDRDADAAALIVPFAQSFFAAWLVTPPAGTPEVLAGMALCERLFRALAGLDPSPAFTNAGGAGRVVIELLTSFPDVLEMVQAATPRDRDVLAERIKWVATETLDDWRMTGARVGALLEIVALVSAVDSRPLSRGESRRLRFLAPRCLAWRPSRDLAAAEVADRLKPLVRARFENELDSAGVWPVKRGATAGAYWRAIAALWERLMDERIPRLCAAEGCNEPIGSRSNRFYCATHRAERQRQRVRESRVRDPGAINGL